MKTLLHRCVGPLAAIALFLVALPGQSAARTEIHFWHAMTGQLGEALETQAKEFNRSQGDWEVKPLRKGTYPETLTAAIAAYRQKSPPHIVQVFEVGTQTMLLSGAIYPVFDLMKDQGVAIEWNDFIKPVVGYYTKDGKLYSMPYNSSTPIFYYSDVIEGEMENIFAGKKTVKQGLDDAVARANALLKEFAATNK